MEASLPVERSDGQVDFDGQQAVEAGVGAEAGVTDPL